MHTEHLQNVRPVRVISGWLVAIAVTSLLMLVLTSMGHTDSESGAPIWGLVIVAVGFFVGGLFAGLRAMKAPILHGILIGLTTLVVWVFVNLVAMLPNDGDLRVMTEGSALGIMLVQIVAAIVGALMGYNLATRGKPGLSEHEPLS